MESPAALSSSTPVNNHAADKLTNEIFAILENKFLFGDDVLPKCVNQQRGKVRILSIDAGDGILAANTLLHLESILRRKSGNPTAHIADFFDVATGAGIGGVLAALLFTRKDGAPLFSAQQSLKFILDNHRKLNQQSGILFRWRGRAGKLLKKVFGDLTLKDTVKAVLIPCYDLTTGAPLVFSRADALEMEGCDFRVAGVCGATVADDRPMVVKSTDGSRKIVAVGGGVGMSNPTAAAITHVLNNKQEFPLCNALQDLLVISLGNAPPPSSYPQIAANGAADMVDQAVSMAFGESRRNNYVRIQGNGGGIINKSSKYSSSCGMLKIVDDMLQEKNVESVLFKGKKVVEYTNMEKVEMFVGEVIKEGERRKNKMILSPVLLKNNNNVSPSPRSSSATTLSTLSS